MLNPYASFLGGQQAEPVIAATPQAIRDLVAPLSSEDLERNPAPGKWNVREVLCHLADTEMVFAFRIRQTLSEPDHVIQPFDQDRWAQTYTAYDAVSALALFSAIRAWNIKLITSIPPAARDKTVTHPERGTMTLQTIIDTMAGHDLNHLVQLRGIVAG
jgi:uncharacterized damage-inducible protein DinB